MTDPATNPDEVRVEPIHDDDRDRIRELLLEVQNLVAGDE